MSRSAIVVGTLITLSLGSSPAVAETTIRFVNGREVVVREYWFADGRLVFARDDGSVGVPREFVAAIEPKPRPTIKAAKEAVNAKR